MNKYISLIFFKLLSQADVLLMGSHFLKGVWDYSKEKWTKSLVPSYKKNGFQNGKEYCFFQLALEYESLSDYYNVM